MIKKIKLFSASHDQLDGVWGLENRVNEFIRMKNNPEIHYRPQGDFHNILVVYNLAEDF